MDRKRNATSRGAWLWGLAALAAGLILLGSPCITRVSTSQAPREEPFARGKALLLEGKYADARASFERALQQVPGNREVRYYRGVAWLKLGNPDAAWADFQATLDAEPGFALGHAGRAQVWIRRSNYVEAEKEIAAALTRDERCDEAYYQQGIVRGYQNKTDEAIAAFEKCLSLNPLHAYGHYQLGLAYNVAARKDLAIMHLEKFVALAPLAPEAAEVRNLLNILKR